MKAGNVFLEFALRSMNIIVLSVYCFLRLVEIFCVWVAYVVDTIAYGLEEVPSVEYVMAVSEKVFDLIFHRWIN